MLTTCFALMALKSAWDFGLPPRRSQAGAGLAFLRRSAASRDDPTMHAALVIAAILHGEDPAADPELRRSVDALALRP